MGNKEELSTKQKFIKGTITSLGMIGIYTNGVTLATNIPEYHNLIFTSTVVVSLISPYLLESTTTYLLDKYNKNKQLKK